MPPVGAVEWIAFVFSIFTLYGCGPEAVLLGFVLLMLGIPVYVWQVRQQSAVTSRPSNERARAARSPLLAWTSLVPVLSVVVLALAWAGLFRHSSLAWSPHSWLPRCSLPSTMPRSSLTVSANRTAHCSGRGGDRDRSRAHRHADDRWRRGSRNPRARHGIRGRGTHEQRHRRLVDPGRDAHWIGGLVQCRGRGASLATVATLATLSMVVPISRRAAWGRCFPPQLAFAAITALALYGPLRCTSDRSTPGLLSPVTADGTIIEDQHATPRRRAPHGQASLLLVALVGVVGNAKLVSPTIERGVIAAGLPISVVGVIIAILILSPETVAALRAARRGRMQVSLNLAFGSAMASIGPTIPTIAVASIWLTGPLHLGLGANHIVLLALTCIVTVLTVVPGRATPVAGRRISRCSRPTCSSRSVRERDLVSRASCVWRSVLLSLRASSLRQAPMRKRSFITRSRRTVASTCSRRRRDTRRSPGATVPTWVRSSSGQGHGPNGETVVFDSQDAINLHNFKHGLPGESFAKPEESKKSEYPSGKFSGLMFGDYYWYYDRHQDGISISDPTPVEGQHGLWFRRIYFIRLHHNEKLTTRFRLEANSNGDFTGGDLTPYVKDVPEVDLQGQPETDARHPSDADVRLVRRLLGLRHIEKTPADLYRLDSSRDFGVTLDGPTPWMASPTRRSSATSQATAPKPRRARFSASKGAMSGTRGSRSKAFIASALDRTMSIDRQRRASRASAPAPAVGGQYLWQQRRSAWTMPLTRRSRSGQASGCGSSSRRKPTCFSAPTVSRDISVISRPGSRGRKALTTGF